MTFQAWHKSWKTCTTQEEKIEMKVLFVALSAELSGGANRSLLSVMKGLRDQWGIMPSVLVPAAGG